MQRNLLFLQQQQQQAAMARQAQQRAAAIGGPGMSMGLNMNGTQTPDPMNPLWAQQQRQQPQQQAQLPINVSPFQQQRPYSQQPQQQQQLKNFPQLQKPATTVPTAPPIVPQLQQPAVQPPNAIKIENEAQKRNLDLYVNRDQEYQATLDIQHKRHMDLAQSKKQEIDVANNERRLRNANKSSAIFGKGYDGFGNGRTGANARILYPNDKKRKRHHHTVKIPYEANVEQANKEETLVPIRIDLESDGFKVRDTFTWNMNESSITPEQFAEITCDDLRLPVSTFSPLIAASIREQIQEFFTNASSMIDEEEEEQINAYNEIVKYKKQKVKVEDQENVKESKPADTKKIELRTIIKLDIIVGNKILNDQFEWDITCKKNSPESFAESMATDLGLGGEFKTAIAHSIREQVYVYIKSLLLTGYEFGDGPVENDELKRSFLPAINNIFRDSSNIEKFTPTLIEVSDAEIAKIEKVRTRESRRKRRGVRNRKGTLPDREPVPTFRTIFASPLDTDMTDDQFMKGMQADPNSSASLHSQRKSAMKARMNIAAEAAGVSLTSGQLENGTVGEDYVPLQGNVDLVTRPTPSKMMDSSWRCIDCGCSPFMTTIIRSGPAGDKTLCNACGLYRYKFNTMRPPNYIDKDIKNDIPHLNDWQSYMSRYRA